MSDYALIGFVSGAIFMGVLIAALVIIDDIRGSDD